MRALCRAGRPRPALRGQRGLALASASLPSQGHLDLTGSTKRNDVPWVAKVVKKEQLSDSVVQLTLEAQREDGLRQGEAEAAGRPFAFRCGQWIDFYVPGMEEVGGFSLCSTPAELPRVRIAVRRSWAAPAAWVHDRAAVGDTVGVRVGGSFWRSTALDPHAATRGVALVGGGIGVSPLLGMLRDWAEWRAGPQGRQASSRLALVHTARRAEDLVWRDEVAELQSRAPEGAIGAFYAATEDAETDADASRRADDAVREATRGDPASWAAPGGVLHAAMLHGARPGPAVFELAGRFIGEGAGADSGAEGAAGLPEGEEELYGATRDPLWYLCGPPLLLDDAARSLRETMGVHGGRVRFERW